MPRFWHLPETQQCLSSPVTEMSKCSELVVRYVGCYLDALPVEDEEDGDGRPEDAGEEAAAQAHLQTRGNVNQMVVGPRPGLGSSVTVGGVLPEPLARQFVVVKMEASVVVGVSEQ